MTTNDQERDHAIAVSVQSISAAERATHVANAALYAHAAGWWAERARYFDSLATSS